LNTLDYRRNAYNYWQWKTLYSTKECMEYTRESTRIILEIPLKPKGSFPRRIFEDYFSFSRILIHSREDISGNKDEMVSLHLEFSADMNHASADSSFL
jgi:hypothetical protein